MSITDTAPKKKYFTVQTITTLAILLAMHVILSRFLSISTPITKIGFSFVPVIVAARKYGIAEGAIVGGMGDLIGALLFPIGTYQVGFTITAALMGACDGLFIHKVADLKRIVSLVLVKQIFLSLCLNTFWISLYYGTPIRELFISRILQAVVIAVVQIIVIQVIVKKGGKVLNNKEFM